VLAALARMENVESCLKLDELLRSIKAEKELNEKYEAIVKAEAESAESMDTN